MQGLEPTVLHAANHAPPGMVHPAFDRPIPDGGYYWHYVDCMSADGGTAVVLIALLGNPFSPEYAQARRRGPASALAFSSMNVALYDRHRGAWSLAERAVQETERSATSLSIGKSTMYLDGDRVVVDIDERTTPLGAPGRPIRGKVILHSEARTGMEHEIDDQGQHRWWPIAPLCRVEVDFPVPGVRFSGHGYHDANAGDVPIESTFEHWDWSRARSEDGAVLTYDVSCTNGAKRSLGFRVSPQGDVIPLAELAVERLATTSWGIDRHMMSDLSAVGRPPRLVRTLENGPFYARSLVETELGGRRVLAMHESLAAHRLRSGLVRLLTRFRMRKFS